MAPRPVNTQYTQDVATHGLDAINARRAATQFDPTTFTQALDAAGQGNGYIDPSARSQGYLDWQRAMNMDPSMGGTVAYGRTGGKYAGFGSKADLQAAIKGQAMNQRQAALGAVSQLLANGNNSLDQLAAQYNQNLPSATTYTPMRGAHDTGAEFAAKAQGNAAGAPQREAYKQALDSWLANQSDHVLSAMETGQQIARTPISDWATSAGAQYGVDPNIIRGWYPDATNLADFRTQRDLQSINNFGGTYGDVQSYDRHNQAAGVAAGKAQDKQSLAAMNDYIFQTTGIDGKKLSTSASLTPQQTYDAVSSPEYQAALADMTNNLNKPDQLTSILHDLAYGNQQRGSLPDPQLYRILASQFAPYLPSNYSLAP